MERSQEQRLIAQAQHGDADAFAQLYQSHVQVIFRYIMYRVGDTVQAEDLTADVFVKALESLSRYRDQGKPFVAWLYRIAHARVVDHYRRSDRRPIASEIDTVVFDPDWDADILRRQAARALRQAIANLTDDQQQVIILRFIEGYRIETVAEVMGKQPNAIKALQFRALRALASRLARSGFDLDTILAGLS